MSPFAWVVLSIPIWVSVAFVLIMALNIAFAPVTHPQNRLNKALDFVTVMSIGTLLLGVAMWMCNL